VEVVMKNSKPISIAPYIDIIFRHRLSALSVFIVGVSATISLVVMLQDVYRSTAVIVIQPAQVASSYVNLDASNTRENPGVADQLEALAYKAFSQERRERLIRKFGLYGYRPGKPMEPRLALMESKIDLVVPQDAIVYETGRPGARSPDVLKISFEYVDRFITQQVTQELADIYVEEGYLERIQRAHDAARFLAKQATEVRGRLDTADSQIKELEQRYQGSLPQELESNLGEISRLQDQLNLINQQIASTHAIPPVSAQGIASSPEQALMMLNLKLNQLRSEFSDEYPDVVQLKQQIADLKLQIKSEPVRVEEKFSSKSEVSPVQSRLEREAGIISTQLEALKRRVTLTPVHGQELAALQRDYDTLATNYHGLLNKELTAQLNEDLEKRHQDERLQVLQPASMARRPVSPNRIAIGVLGVCFSTFAALALPFGLYFTDTSFKDPEELQSEFSIPVVATLPIVGAAKEARAATIRALGASFIGILVTTAAIWAYTRHLL
jgi:succinoglycan biosynthesis transport protein ExoP